MIMAEEWKNQIEERIEAIESAFPHKDYEGHKRGHEALVENVEWKKKLYNVIVEKALSGIVWAGIVALGLAIWHEFQSIFTRH